MFFADLTPYEYGREEPVSHILNVGWLSREHPFRSGETPAGLVEALRRWIATPVNLYRGRHLCEFCPEPVAFLDRQGHRTIEPPPDTAGNGEIRVPGADGRVYVAPVLVAHYVEVHEYLPPPEFVEAVLSSRGIASVSP